MPYYGDYYAGDPGLFGKIFKGLKKIRLGSIIGRAVLPGLGFRPAAPAKGVVTKAQEVRAVAVAKGTAASPALLRSSGITATAARRKPVSSFTARQAAARRARLRQLGYNV
jgi:hypothetical protein